MKLVIDIPEEVVTAIQNGQDYRYDIHTAIAQGTPVSNDGDLISRSDLRCEVQRIKTTYTEMSATQLGYDILSAIDNAPSKEVNYADRILD